MKNNKMTVDQESAATNPTKKSRSPILALLPLFIFFVLAGLFYFQLISGKDTSAVPSALIGKPIPDFDLKALEGIKRDGKALPGFSTASTKGAPVTLINVWASWCVPCRQEHPYITALGDNPTIRLYGLNHKDQPENARKFLEDLGNPYDAIGVDRKGRVSIDFGVYGVPETFVVDKDGFIVHKFIGPIDPARLRSELMPAIQKALARSASE